MKRNPKPEEEVGFQLAPMIDMTFLLLVFFMVTAKPTKPESDIDIGLPGTAEQSEALDIPDEQQVAILEDGTISLNELAIGAPDDTELAQLFTLLRRLKLTSEASGSQPLVTIEKPKATFELKQQIRIDPEERQHRIEMAEMESLRPKPVVNNRIQSLRPTPFALPELPQIPVDDTPPIDPNALIAENLDSLVTARTGTGLGAGGGFFGGAGKAGSGLLEGTYYDF